MSGNAYQLRHFTTLPVGAFVVVGGPHDKYGTIYGHGDPDDEGGRIHLIRGIGKVLPHGKAAYTLRLPPRGQGPID